MITPETVCDIEASMSQLGTLAYRLSGANLHNTLMLLAMTAASLTVSQPEAEADQRAERFINAYRGALPLVRQPRVMCTAPATGRA